MKLVVLGDVHLISNRDPYKNLHAIRHCFKCGWPSFQRLLRIVNDESPDIVILLGDLVDWVSEENIGFGLDLLSLLKMPWYMTPGNHDFEKPVHGHNQRGYEQPGSRTHLNLWKSFGVTLENACIPFGRHNLILFDNSLSRMTHATSGWLKTTLEEKSSHFLFSHVPCDTPAVRNWILSVDPSRNMKKYVASNNGLLPIIKGEGRHVFSGHLHFPGYVEECSTAFHLCSMSVRAYGPCRPRQYVAEATVLVTGAFGVRVQKIKAW